MTSRTRTRPATLERSAAVTLLAAVSGITDALGLVALGGTFSSVMTGNLVFVGVGIGRGDMDAAGHALVAIVAFVAGCVVGTRLAGRPRPGDPVWPLAVTAAFAVETLVFVAGAVLWWTAGSAPSSGRQLVLLALFAVALGVQSAAIQRFGVSGLSTTYMTGTLTTVVVQLASGSHPRTVRLSVQLLVALVVGAALAALVHAHARSLVPLLQLLPMALVLAAAVLVRRRG